MVFRRQLALGSRVSLSGGWGDRWPGGGAKTSECARIILPPECLAIPAANSFWIPISKSPLRTLHFGPARPGADRCPARTRRGLFPVAVTRSDLLPNMFETKQRGVRARGELATACGVPPCWVPPCLPALAHWRTGASALPAACGAHFQRCFYWQPFKCLPSWLRACFGMHRSMARSDFRTWAGQSVLHFTAHENRRCICSTRLACQAGRHLRAKIGLW